MVSKIREFNKTYSTLFFCISLLIIIIFLAYFSVSNRNTSKICTIPNKLVNNYTNYSYDITYIKDDKKIDLYVKRFESKYLIEKVEDGLKSTYYIYYTDIFEKASNGEYIRFRKDNIVDGLDNKMLLLDYVNDISLESSVRTENELTCYYNRKMELLMCINLDDSISIEANDYKIEYKIKEVAGVRDFKIDVNLDYVEESIDGEVDNNIEE